MLLYELGNLDVNLVLHAPLVVCFSFIFNNLPGIAIEVEEMEKDLEIKTATPTCVKLGGVGVCMR